MKDLLQGWKPHTSSLEDAARILMLRDDREQRELTQVRERLQGLKEELSAMDRRRAKRESQ